MTAKPRHVRTIVALVACTIVAALSTASARAQPGPAASGAFGPEVQVRPPSGPGGTALRVRGAGFYSPSEHGCDITISFTDASGTTTTLSTLRASATFKTPVTIPDGAAVGQGTFLAEQWDGYLGWLCHRTAFRSAGATFTVTG